jgi:hypothetical protein
VEVEAVRIGNELNLCCILDSSLHIRVFAGALLRLSE